MFFLELQIYIEELPTAVNQWKGEDGEDGTQSSTTEAQMSTSKHSSTHSQERRLECMSGCIDLWTECNEKG